MARKIIIDTDPGVDDAMAIQFALASSEFDIVGLTTVFGNVDVETATTNALRLLHLASKPLIPVARGASKPLHKEFDGGVAFVHGEDGQGNTWQPASALAPISSSAAEFIVEQVLQSPTEITIAALGPLTNLATALAMAPEIQHNVREVVIMGGNAFCEGNITPAAEANIYADPEAADIVLGAAWPVTMVGLDVTHAIVLHKDVLQEIALSKSPINKHVTSAYVFYQDFFMKYYNIPGSYVHDSSVFAYLLDNQLFKTVKCPVRVETVNCLSKGKTWPCLRQPEQDNSGFLTPWRERPPVTICIDVDSDAVVNLLKSRLGK